MKNRLVILSLISALITSFSTAPSPAADTESKITANFENFYAPVNKQDCPNGMLVITRRDKAAFTEFDNFSLTVNNSKGKVLASSYNETFATEDGAKKIEMPVRICGDDPEYFTPTESYTLQLKFVSADRKYAEELQIPFVLIPVDAKAKAAALVRSDCGIDSPFGEVYYINWDLVGSPKVKIGKTFTINGTFYRFGYPADFEKITLTSKTLTPDKEIILATAVTDANGKFKLAWKISNKNYPSFILNVDERRRAVGPFYGTFNDAQNIIFIDCFSTCSLKKIGPLYDRTEGKPAKSTGQCAVTKHEYSLVAAKSSVSYTGSEDKDRNLWLKGLLLIKNSIADASVLASKQTTAFQGDSSATKSKYYGSATGGSVWVSGHMRNGHYVRGYSRRR